MDRPHLHLGNIRDQVDSRPITSPEGLNKMKTPNDFIGIRIRVLWPLMNAKYTETDGFNRSILTNAASTQQAKSHYKLSYLTAENLNNSLQKI